MAKNQQDLIAAQQKTLAGLQELGKSIDAVPGRIAGLEKPVDLTDQVAQEEAIAAGVAQAKAALDAIAVSPDIATARVIEAAAGDSANAAAT